MISDKVLAAREQGMLLREQAVLARTGHDTDLLELELSRRGIPYRKYGGLRYLDAAHVKDLLASFRLVERPGDQLAWFRLLQLIDGVGPGRARRACDLLLAGDPPSLATLEARWTTARDELPLSAREQADAVVAAVAAGGDGDGAGAVVAERLRDAVAPLVRAHYIDGAIAGHRPRRPLRPGRASARPAHVRRRARARSAVVLRRPRRASAPRRRLARPVDRSIRPRGSSGSPST